MNHNVYGLKYIARFFATSGRSLNENDTKLLLFEVRLLCLTTVKQGLDTLQLSRRRN